MKSAKQIDMAPVRSFIRELVKELLSDGDRRIKEDYGNGKEYYAFHGKRLAEIPDHNHERLPVFGMKRYIGGKEKRGGEPLFLLNCIKLLNFRATDC